MTNIKTVRDFAKSRYTVCFLIAMVGLYSLRKYSLADLTFLSNSEWADFVQNTTSKLFDLQVFLGSGAITDIVKLSAFLWILIFLVPVLSGNKQVSLIIGGICIITSFFLFGMLKDPVVTIGNKLFSLLFLYFGWYIAANANIVETGYSPTKTTFNFLFSRMFIGFNLMVTGFILLHHCFASANVFINFTKTDNLQYFLYGNGCILVGMLLFFANRIASGMVVGLLTMLFCALMILQLPTIVLFFKGQKNLIGTYYSNVAFHWSMIVAVIAYGIVAYTIFITSWAWKVNVKQAEQNNENSGDDESVGWVCVKCNEQNDNGAIFCKSCGEYK